MTPKASAATQNDATNKLLPWWLGGAAFICYAITLSHWISLPSLGPVTTLLNDSWRQQPGRPLALLLFGPLRLLPDQWLPLIANVITALLAAVTLVQLARSVAILRHDTVAADPMRQRPVGLQLLTGRWAWLPPALAVLTLGLQRGFWTHATSASGELPSLLCGALAFRCVLEFRLAPKETWLYRGALVYAVGLTDNWLLLGYLPVFVAAIIWVKGFSPFLELRFLARLGGWALLGLSLYLLAPTLLVIGSTNETSFWAALKSYLVTQKNSLFLLRGPAFRLWALTALLPFLLLAVKWRSHSVQLADDTHLGVFITKATGHFIHTLFFVASLWVALEPVFTPRQHDLGIALLLYHYSWALVTGYCAGYLWLFAQPRAGKIARRWPVGALFLMLVIVPAGLAWKNLGAVRLTNSNGLREYARQLHEDLPSGTAAVLSDDPLALTLLRVEANLASANRELLPINTRLLTWPSYHRQMAQKYPSRWPKSVIEATSGTLGPAVMLATISQIASNEPLVYLHPSSGLFYETFNAAPHGWAQCLSPRTAAPRFAPAELISANEPRWETRWNEHLQHWAKLFVADREHTSIWSRAPWNRLRLSERPNETAAILSRAYAKTLNHWAVQLARMDERTNAIQWYQRAVALDPDNLAARINLEFAARQQRGETNRLTLAWARTNYADTLAQFETWANVISRCGPVDEPTFLLRSGRMYLHAANPQQARDCFARSVALAPDWAAPKLWLAQTHNALGDSAAALKLTANLVAAETSLPTAALARALQCHATALHQTGQPDEAIAFVERFTTKHQDKVEVIAAAAEWCALAGRFEAELTWRERLLRRDPNRVDWLVKKGHAELRTARHQAAVKTLTTALASAPNNPEARLYRAIALLQLGLLDDARRDYQQLLKDPAHAQSARFGLGGIAWRQSETNAMIQYYQAFLTNSATASPQAALAEQRLKQWQED